MGDFSKAQTWAALKKCWKAYKIAKAQNDREKMIEYAKRIRSLQKELGLPQSEFECLKT
jgi:hypothetical protein